MSFGVELPIEQVTASEDNTLFNKRLFNYSVYRPRKDHRVPHALRIKAWAFWGNEISN